MTNLLIALKNIIQNPVNDIVSNYKGYNRANSVGDALEQYIKDVFCNSLLEKDSELKDEIYGKNLSYLGNQNNPPDFIIRGGDAVEIKKIESFASPLALNSSHPKDKLYPDDSRITNAEAAKQKNGNKKILYHFNLKISTLCFIFLV